MRLTFPLGQRLITETAQDSEDDQDLVFQYLRRQNQMMLFKSVCHRHKTGAGFDFP